MEMRLVTEHPEKPRDLRGSMTALVTPFRNGEVDWPCLENLVDRQIDGGTDWLVALGTTGESPTLSQAERHDFLEAVIARVSGRCPVMAGTGASSTAEAVARTRHAASAGADAALVVAPCYNRPTPEGLFRHFAKVAEAADLRIVLYNVPARTGVNIDNDVIVRLRETCPNIVAIKDATGSVAGVTDLRSRCDIAVLSGDDSLTWPFMALGAVGVISVIANLVPALMKSLVSAALRGDAQGVLQIHRKVYDLAVGIGRFGPNPLPIKTAMAVVGLIAEEFRLPLCPLGTEARAGIELALRRHEILEEADV
jgi:4-hydroxy-tetrahydrodipicolinate synthase